MKAICQTLVAVLAIPSALGFNLVAIAAQLRIPAYTAYLDPNVDGAHVSERTGITSWENPALKVLWFGEEFARPAVGKPPVDIVLPELPFK
jgi:hypothetical protein